MQGSSFNFSLGCRSVRGPLLQAESGVKAADIYRNLGITETSFYRWKKQFEHLGSPSPRNCGSSGGERAAQAPGSGPQLGQAHPAGGAVKKSLRAAVPRELYT